MLGIKVCATKASSFLNFCLFVLLLFVLFNCLLARQRETETEAETETETERQRQRQRQREPEDREPDGKEMSLMCRIVMS